MPEAAVGQARCVESPRPFLEALAQVAGHARHRRRHQGFDAQLFK
jgi:hypothetical protein